MKPRGPMMIEHRLIEKMLAIAVKEISLIKKNKKTDVVFIDTMVDFIRIYADRTHHGKEEDILFRDLAKKKMSPEDEKMMMELVDEHTYARKTVGELVDAKNRYAGGDSDALDIIIDKMSELTKFYPVHIQKEDNEFFPNTERYFSKEELDAMLSEFWEFDRKMIHEKYGRLCESLSAGYK
jgi:hemerythrin-like domain-containing protein